jgi:hypothetical protein
MRFVARYLLVLAVVCLFSFLPVPALAGDNWRPLDPAEVALKEPVVEKDADAEAIFWEVKVNDDPNGDLIFDHYIRIKVFTERGRESQSKVDIPFGNYFGSNIRIQDIAARTIKPDGNIVELKKSDVFERTVVKGSGLKVKVKSFAVPGLEPGSIIEYRWREVRVNQTANYVRLEFQRDIPVQRIKYLIKPFPFEGLRMQWITLNGENTDFTKEKDGFFGTSMTNIPALHEEPRMPPDNQLKTWMLVYYTREEKIDAEKYWFDLGRNAYNGMKQLIKVNDEVKQASATAIGDAKTDDERIARLFEFTRTKIKNSSDDASGLSAEEKKKLKENKTPSDTLKRGIGDSDDIDMLFAALASAAGYDARVVLAPNRGDFFFDKKIPNAYFLRHSYVALKVADNWRFYKPGISYIPMGMLRWQDEGQAALITDPKQPVWLVTPMSNPDKSEVKRRANLTLAEDGTIEGDVQIEYTGQMGMERKEDNDEDSATQREESLKDEVKAHLSTAEVTEIHVENVTDPVKPFTYRYHIKVPGYAQRTGKRLFLQPAFFQHGYGPLFSASTRKYPVYFHYPWLENDEISLHLPQGFTLDNADAPAPFSGGAVGDYKATIGITKDGHGMIYKRRFFFGGAGNILFPVNVYPQIKEFFDALNKQDGHTITLKQAASTGAND